MLMVYGDGTQSRVFCHVLDAVNAVTETLKSEKSIGEVFNIGGIGEVTINELAEKVITLTKSNSKTEYIPYELAYARGYEDMQRRIPDISKVSNFLNWKPERLLPEIIADVASSI